MFSDLDFEDLSQLYKNDPEKFEELRIKEIEKIIQGAPQHHQRRLRGIQFQIDATRKIHKDSPIGACVAISKKMHESFNKLRIHLNQAANRQDPLGEQTSPNEVKSYASENSAKVLQFR